MNTETAVITCPHCGKSTEETMPTDSSVYFYECPKCRSVLRPKTGRCCVFCSYANVPCPSRQRGSWNWCGWSGLAS